MTIKKITLLLFLLPLFLNSQTINTSLISEYNRLLSKDQDSTVFFCNQLIGSKKNEIKAYGLAGKAYVNILQSKFKLADDLYNQALFLLKKNSSQINGDAKANILYLHALGTMERQDLEATISTLNNALKHCSRYSSFILKTRLQSTLARAYSLANNHKEAIAISRLTLTSIKSNPQFSTNKELRKEYAKELVKASYRLINLYLSDKEKYTSYLDSTQLYITTCEKFSKRNSIRNYNGNIATCNADINFYKKQYDSAKYYYKKGLTFYKKKNYKKRIAQILFKIAECEYFLTNYKAAKVIFLEQMNTNIWSEFQLLENKASTYFYLFKIYEKEREQKKALVYADRFSDEIKKHLKFKNATDLLVNTIVLRKEKQEEIEGYIKNYELQQLKNKRYQYILLLLLAITLLLIIFSVILKRKNKENISKLNTRIKQLQHNISSNRNTSAHKKSSLTDEEALKLLGKLKALEKEQLFQQQNYTLNLVAKKLKTNSSYLSKTVNKHIGLTFAEYTNSLKINAIIIKLNEQKNFRNYTIDALAKEAGYKSVNSFNSNFKKLLKVTPSQYLKELKRNH